MGTLLITEFCSLRNSNSTPQLNAAGTEYTDVVTSLTPGTQYDFDLWTTAAEDDETSFAFAKALARTTGTAPVAAPAAPQNIMTKVVTGKTVADNVVHLAWTNSSNNETGFKIERQESTGSDPSWKAIATVGADVTTYDDTGVRPGQYVYEIVAFNSGGQATVDRQVSVWPPGYLVAFDGTTDVYGYHSIIADFYDDYHGTGKKYVPGVPWTPLIFGLQLLDQFRTGWQAAVDFYQSAANRKNVPLDIAGYSRGAYAGLALADLFATNGIPDLSKTKTVLVPVYGQKDHIIGYKSRIKYTYFADKPTIRYMGLVSPTGQSSLLSETIALATWGTVQFNPDWTTNVPGGAFVWEAMYDDPIEGGVLPQPVLDTSVPVYIPPGATHTSLSHSETDSNIEQEMWKVANSQNVPVPQMPSRWASDFGT